MPSQNDAPPPPVVRGPENGQNDAGIETRDTQRWVMGHRVTRYSAIVQPMRQELGHWSVHVQVSDERGTIIRQMLIDSASFRTRDDAGAVGWRLADAWIRRFGRTATGS